MFDGTKRPKIPSKLAKRAARYNAFGCKSPLGISAQQIFMEVSVKFLGENKIKCGKIENRTRGIVTEVDYISSQCLTLVNCIVNA